MVLFRFYLKLEYFVEWRRYVSGVRVVTGVTRGPSLSRKKLFVHLWYSQKYYSHGHKTTQFCLCPRPIKGAVLHNIYFILRFPFFVSRWLISGVRRWFLRTVTGCWVRPAGGQRATWPRSASRRTPGRGSHTLSGPSRWWSYQFRTYPLHQDRFLLSRGPCHLSLQQNERSGSETDG